MNARLRFASCGLFALHVLAIAATAADPSTLVLHTRARTVDAKDPAAIRIVDKTLEWDARKTAVIVCDMWDKHWCSGASVRVAEMAPRMNDLLVAARKRGALIVHSPSDTMDFYRDAPQRKLSLDAPAAKLKTPLKRWCGLDPEHEPPLPIDDKDGGCDTPGDKPHKAWTRQIDTLKIEADDAIGDSFDVVNLLEQRGIENVILLGVHTNMCVLGRPFGIRQMVYQGKNVVLVRDLTDAMYNPASKPQISHFGGTDRVIAHIEQHWCPTVTSSDFLGGPPLRFKGDTRPQLVFLANEDEYQAAQTLADFAARLERTYDTACTVLDGRKQFGIEGIEAIERADAVVLYVRRRPMPKAQMDVLRRYLDAGKPLVALRTSSHAFAVRKGTLPEGVEQWPTFDRDVLGGEYKNHLGNAQGTDIAPVGGNSAADSLLAGVEPLAWHSKGSLYRSENLDPQAKILLQGTTGDQSFPVVWTRHYKKARVFYTSLGHPDDFAQPQFRQLLINAIYWAMDRKAPATSR